MKTIVATAVHQGLVREYQQDRVLVLDGLGVYVLADGMGGLTHGEVAAEIATNESWWRDLVTRGKKVESVIQEANYLISKKAIEYQATMGTTIVVAEEWPNDSMRVHWVGDSRGYVFSFADRLLTQLTMDHEDPGGGLTRALVGEPVQSEFVTQALHIGDIVMLASDGLFDMVGHDSLEEIFMSWQHKPGAYELAEESARMRGVLLPKLASSLVDEANSAGGRDNTSVILIQRIV